MKKLGRVWPVAAQGVGAGVGAYGICLLAGLAWALVVAGVALVAVGTLAEMKGSH